MGNTFPIPPAHQDDIPGRNLVLSEALSVVWAHKNIRAIRRQKTLWQIEVGPLASDEASVSVTESPRTEESRNAALIAALQSDEYKDAAIRGVRRTTTGWVLELS